MAKHLVGFAMRSRCIYDSRQCSEEPIYYILMGCLNQHTGEGAICMQHAKQWIELYNDQDLACTDCDEDLAEYILFPSKDLL